MKGCGNAETASGGIDEDELGVLECPHLYHRLLADRSTVTRVECHAVDFDRAFGLHQIAVARFTERVFRRRTTL